MVIQVRWLLLLLLMFDSSVFAIAVLFVSNARDMTYTSTLIIFADWCQRKIFYRSIRFVCPKQKFFESSFAPFV